MRRCGHLIDGGFEDGLIGARRLAVAAELANVLESSSPDVGVRDWLD
jgi:hypothetical protein